MIEILHISLHLLKQHPDQKRLKHFRVKSLLNVACTTVITSCELIVDEQLMYHVMDALIFLKAQCHCNEPGLSLSTIIGLNFFQALCIKE